MAVTMSHTRGDSETAGFMKGLARIPGRRAKPAPSTERVSSVLPTTVR